MREIRTRSDPESAALEAAREFLARAQAAATHGGSFSVCLSGGSTPHQLYHLLAGDSRFPEAEYIPWDRTHVFWGDERVVPPDHPDSNYLAARNALLDHVPVPKNQIHRLEGERHPADAADRYEACLRSHFASSDAEPFPRFDLALLGIGADGHTASLFPGTRALEEQVRWVTANRVDQLNTDRLTLTLPVFNHAACVLFLVTGSGKATVLKDILSPGEKEGPVYPASRVQPVQGDLLWILDRAAAPSPLPDA